MAKNTQNAQAAGPGLALYRGWVWLLLFLLCLTGFSGAARAQRLKITFKVIDEAGKPVPNAQIKIERNGKTSSLDCQGAPLRKPKPLHDLPDGAPAYKTDQDGAFTMPEARDFPADQAPYRITVTANGFNSGKDITREELPSAQCNKGEFVEQAYKVEHTVGDSPTAGATPSPMNSAVTIKDLGDKLEMMAATQKKLLYLIPLLPLVGLAGLGVGFVIIRSGLVGGASMPRKNAGTGGFTGPGAQTDLVSLKNEISVMRKEMDDLKKEMMRLSNNIEGLLKQPSGQPEENSPDIAAPVKSGPQETNSQMLTTMQESPLVISVGGVGPDFAAAMYRKLRAGEAIEAQRIYLTPVSSTPGFTTNEVDLTQANGKLGSFLLFCNPDGVSGWVVPNPSRPSTVASYVFPGLSQATEMPPTVTAARARLDETEKIWRVERVPSG